MKRVGIITIHHSPNYGACLQSYALYKYIVQQGAYCEIIDVHRPIHSDYIYEKRYSSYRNNQFKPSVRKMCIRDRATSDYPQPLLPPNTVFK